MNVNQAKPHSPQPTAKEKKKFEKTIAPTLPPPSKNQSDSIPRKFLLFSREVRILCVTPCKKKRVYH